MLPGSAGFAPASRRRGSAPSGPRRALGRWCGDAALYDSLLSYGSRWRAAPAHARRYCDVVRRRRDATADAPSSGSRVRLCSLHHVTPADDAPRCCVCCVFFPDHRLSNSGSSSVSVHDTDRRVPLLHRVVDGETQNAPPGSWRRWGVSNRSDPVVEWVCATARPLGIRTLHHCFPLRAIGNRTRPLRCSSLPSSAFDRPAVPFACRARRRRRPSTGARRLPSRRWARASSRRTGAGRRAVGGRWRVECAWSWDQAVRRFVMEGAIEHPETRNRAADDRPTKSGRGWANAYAMAWCIDS